MKDIIDFIELPDKVVDEELSIEVQVIVDGILEKVSFLYLNFIFLI